MTVSRQEVAIIGAGPYGLSLAAHLRSRRLKFRIFGHAMRPWSRMHAGMGLKSPDFGTNIYAPVRGFRFVEWCRERGLSTVEPIAIDLFTEYGRWAQECLVPDLEATDVIGLRRSGAAFLVTLASGETVHANRVVVATGLSNFERMPKEVRGLPSSLASHTTEHRDYSAFSGNSVAVIGGGASALEAGVMLREAGASVEVLVRGSSASVGGPKPPHRTLRDRILQPSSVMGPGRKSFLLQRLPMATHYLPTDRRVRFVRTFLGPAAGWWLRDRAEGLAIRTRTEVLGAAPTATGVRLRLRAQTGERDLEVDHVVCGTGFEVDVDRLPFLDAGLAARLRRIVRAPALSRHFESSVEGLYFIGPSSAFSFGPLFRFVAGAAYAVPVVARHLARNRRSEQVPAIAAPAREPA
jgi:cation diffusion facilitator CzcD-associated flavoprotein CzcO